MQNNHAVLEYCIVYGMSWFGFFKLWIEQKKDILFNTFQRFTSSLGFTFWRGLIGSRILYPFFHESNQISERYIE